MKRSCLILCLLMVSLWSCRTLHVADFHSTNTRVSEAPLPRLGLLIHQNSFGDAFDRETIEKGYNGTIPAPFVNAGSTDFYTLSDRPLEDVYTLFGNELNDHLISTTGERYGHVRFKLLHYDRRTPGWGYRWVSAATLGTSNLFGVPYSRVSAELELQVEVTDADKKVLARYRAPGVGKAYIAVYYGYQFRDAWRKANLNALKNAMGSIRNQMAADLPTLNEQLTAAGPLKK